ncbi:MAG: DUF4175 family protein [Proteobacteria bacterium]|uniref:DUF4175 family protein n=1 Tax=Rudaea sp. TaxID=2136325 RepID=UPI00321FFEA0|nr:DUF4175 family protein [Pseudomonadota bacterium]
MSLDPRLHRLRTASARRRLGIVAAVAAPIVIAAGVLAARIGGPAAAIVVVAIALACCGVGAWRAWQGIDAVWLARRLDAAAPQMDDSAALLFRDAAALSQLQRLQRTRVQARLAEIDADLRPGWPWSLVFAAFVIAAALLIAAALWQPHARNIVEAERANVKDNAASTALTRMRIGIAPPAYTQLPPRAETALDAKAPEGSRLLWDLRFDPQPAAAALVFHDGSRVALTRDGEDWSGARVLAASTLYRIAVDGAPPPADDRLHRLDAIADRAPEVRVLEPGKTLTLLDAQQKNWNLAFEASDDYGIASAELQITLAQGSGENVRFKEQTLALQGEPAAAKQQRFRHTLDLAALGIAQGDDVIVRLAVSDNREPQANTTRSASFILRWPAEASTDSSGLEGIVQKTLPAYFRSQRQIIIDSEALLAERAKLDEKKFLDRSDAIGADQKILRLRYGQFLGEESETHAHDDHDAHAPAAAEAAAAFGKEGDLVAEYGHTHDIAEAATLLDPETRATLKSALAEMWQAELHLRQGDPAQALPYEYRALEFVKRVQQSTRIYLARVGLELPVPDETRRLSGERKDVADRSGTLAAASDGDSAIARLWKTLAANEAPDWDAAEAWLRTHAASAPDALGVFAAIDRARRDPACAPCRVALRDQLWPLLPAPSAGVLPRAAPETADRVYLDALQTAEPGASR